MLWCDNPGDADTWSVKTFVGPEVRAAVPAPPPECVGQKLTPRDPAHAAAAHWFIAASEALGDAAIGSVASPEGSLERVEQLEALVAAVPDHELLHQALGDAARAAAAGAPA